jgi:hypothetical protein
MDYQDFCRSHGGVRITRNRGTATALAQVSASPLEAGLEDFVRGRDKAWSPRPKIQNRVNLTRVALSSPTDPNYEPMGSQHYSCRLRLSRTNLYILYINRATEQKRPSSSGFSRTRGRIRNRTALLPSRVFRSENTGLLAPEAIPKVALPARAGAESLHLNVSERGFRFGATA